MNLAGNIGYMAVVTLLCSALGACSSLVPPQMIADPIGVSGRQVQIEIGATGELQTASAGVGIIQSTFADLDTSSIPINLNLLQSLFKVGFAAETKLMTTTGSLPCGIILTKVDIDVTLKDASNSYTLPTFKVNKVVELEQQKDDLKSYKILTEDAFVGIALSGEDARKLQNIMTTGGDNEATVRVTVQATSVPELAPDSLLTFTFETSEATLTF